VFDLDGLGEVRKVRWKDLTDGMVYLGGLHVNDVAPPELRDFPVLSRPLLRRVTESYRLRPEREVLIASPVPGFDPRAFSSELRAAASGLAKLDELRREYVAERRRALVSLGLPPETDIPIIGSPAVEQEALIKDVYNSFAVRYGANSALPSFLNRPALRLTLGDLLSGRLRKLMRFPADREVLLHLVVDYSYSMKVGSKHELVVAAVNLFHRYVTEFLLKTRVRLYAFSDVCKPVDFPLEGGEIRRGDTAYATFMKKVLHHKDPEVHNSVIVFTDGRPQDQPEALRLAALMRTNRIDYTQIVFRMPDDLRFELQGGLRPGEGRDGYVDERPGLSYRELSDTEVAARLSGVRGAFTEIAQAAGGNQILLAVDELAGLVSVECYDRYVGLLTLATTPEVAAVEASRAPPVRRPAARPPAPAQAPTPGASPASGTAQAPAPKGAVRPFVPPRIERKAR
jgi:hypothetical protein